jgi:hypothetical protein
LPPFQSLTTEPSPPSIDSDDVAILGVVSPPDALTPAVKTNTRDHFTLAADGSTHASRKETEVSNIIAFFNPLPAIASKKPRCNTLRECFHVTPNGGEGVIVTCKNCTKFGARKWKAFNATYAREHALKCHGVSIEVCTLLLQNSQAGKLNKIMSMLTPPPDSTLGGEMLSSIRKSALFKCSETYPKRLKQTSLIRTTEEGMITKMPVDEMERVYKAEVEAVLYCQEPLERLLDPMVIAALTLRHPAMKSFIPQHRTTIYNKYVVPINIATTNELVKYFGLLPGMATVSFDGVMVNRKSKVRWSSTPSSYDFVHDVSPLSYF